ncbi:hypothetical protein MMC24_005086 [Lignoscripta atroalba]|nr:hypothetical protein [Lignoscripta atroalba]
MDQDLNQEIALCEAVVSRVKDLLTSGSNSWRSCLETVRTTITTLENSAFLSSPSLLDEQVKLVSTFQKLAYQEPDNGGEVDIASWCVRQWATMLQRHPNSLDSLKARIDREERSSSSDTSSSSNVASRAQDLRQSRRDHDRIYTPDYIEARDLLRPALEYLARAVEVAEMQVSIDGHLLTLVSGLLRLLFLGRQGSSERFN